MQRLDLDPDRPHGLRDLIDRMSTESSGKLSWDDVSRVREYVGAGWPRRPHSNAYDLAYGVLCHLADVDTARAAVSPYEVIACLLHEAVIGVPCGQRPQIWVPFDLHLQLPSTPAVCTWRVLAKHDRLSAMEIFARRPPAFGRDILSFSAELPGAAVTARVQYRQARPLVLDRIVVSGADDWTIHDVRVGGVSLLAPHLDLPGALFSNGIMGPQLSPSVIEQDQWVEIEARCNHGGTPWFRGCIIGNIESRKEVMNNPLDSDHRDDFQEQPELQVIKHFAACEHIRKKLELPIEALVLIDRALQRDSARCRSRMLLRSEPSGMAQRSPLRLLSEKKIKPTDPITGKPTFVHVRPQTIAMRVEEIEILSEPDHWMIADVLVGTRSQFPQSGPPLPGRLFVPGGTCYHFVTETIQTAMDFTLLVHYVGPEAEGGIFEAVAMGSSTSY